LLRHVGLSRVKGGDPDHGPGLSWPGTSWSVRCDFALKEIADQGDHLIGLEDTNDRALRSSQTWTDGATRFLKGYVAEGSDAATATERVFANAFSGAEDALVGFIATGKLEFRGLADSILVGLARTTVRQTITAPIAGALQNAFAGGGLFGLFHEGGIAGERPPGVRYADASVFDHAPRYHGGGFAGSGLLPDEVPIIARRGELVVPPERVVREEKSAREQRLITVVVKRIAELAGGKARLEAGVGAGSPARHSWIWRSAKRTTTVAPRSATTPPTPNRSWWTRGRAALMLHLHRSLREEIVEHGPIQRRQLQREIECLPETCPALAEVPVDEAPDAARVLQRRTVVDLAAAEAEEQPAQTGGRHPCVGRERGAIEHPETHQVTHEEAGAEAERAVDRRRPDSAAAEIRVSRRVQHLSQAGVTAGLLGRGAPLGAHLGGVKSKVSLKPASECADANAASFGSLAVASCRRDRRIKLSIRAAVAPAIQPLAEATRLRSTPDSSWETSHAYHAVSPSFPGQPVRRRGGRPWCP
jgi:hypothetical protein